ncbi:MAG: hypothetical protein H5T91_04840 [Synergistetes bacterium]|nr:MAG: Sodium/calcium exchanger membrane region [bacterium 42_11]MBC7331735.1 hypothetical protein [Synergistota bacterium]MDK2871324.1 cation:H+ antiporter [bacterium]
MSFWFIVFFLSSIGVVGGGIVLERATEEWAERKGVTKEWAGFIILSIITSSPELATAISGALKGYPNMVVGDILGGNLLNIAVFSLLSFLWYNLFRHLNRRVFFELIWWNIGFSFVMLFALKLKTNLLWVFLIYPLVAFRVFERPSELGVSHKSSSKANFVVYFGISVITVIVSSYFLMVSGAQLSKLTNITDTFIGTLFIAIVTSAPELSVSFTALLRKAHGLCVGNILGSNLLNFFILPVADIFFKGPFVAFTSSEHMVTVSGLIFASLLSLISILFSVKFLRLIPVVVYIVVIFFLSRGV